MINDNPWDVLGDRLNLEKGDVQELAACHNDSDFELPFAVHRVESDDTLKGGDVVEHPATPLPRAQRVVCISVFGITMMTN